MRSPLSSVSSLLSSSRVFILSIQSVSTGPSNRIHFWSELSSLHSVRMMRASTPSCHSCVPSSKDPYSSLLDRANGLITCTCTCSHLIQHAVPIGITKVCLMWFGHCWIDRTPMLWHADQHLSDNVDQLCKIMCHIGVLSKQQCICQLEVAAVTFWNCSLSWASLRRRPMARCKVCQATLLPAPVLPTIMLPCLATLQSKIWMILVTNSGMT